MFAKVGEKMTPESFGLSVPIEALRPLLKQIVNEVLAEMEASRAQTDGKLAYTEDEAARLLGLESHQLRDERRRGRIAASQIVGRRIRYTRQDLIDYLLARRTLSHG